MESVSSRIWTRVAVSISYDDNHYNTGTLFPGNQLSSNDPHTYAIVDFFHLTLHLGFMRTWLTENLMFINFYLILQSHMRTLWESPSLKKGFSFKYDC